MVVQEHSKSVNIIEVGFFRVVPFFNFVHGITTNPDISDVEEQWIVEESSQIPLIAAHVGGAPVKHLSHLEDSCSIPKLIPEPFWDFRDCVDSDSIKVKSFNHSGDPILKILSDFRVLLFQVREAGESAVFHVFLIIPVSNLAVRMIVFSFAEGIDLIIVEAYRCHMVCHNISHDPNVPLMSSLNQILQVLGSAEVRIHFFKVCGCIPMVTVLIVFCDGRNPNGIEAQALDIV
mmetsp:Transcript_3241/g.3187  ORF Transcript_3241/g.3187 Transcript_3241/m.3187 type:complete len:233 (+) Transcript_3241:572-1270(+)